MDRSFFPVRRLGVLRPDPARTRSHRTRHRPDLQGIAAAAQRGGVGGELTAEPTGSADTELASSQRAPPHVGRLRCHLRRARGCAQRARGVGARRAPARARAAPTRQRAGRGDQRLDAAGNAGGQSCGDALLACSGPRRTARRARRRLPPGPQSRAIRRAAGSWPHGRRLARRCAGHWGAGAACARA